MIIPKRCIVVESPELDLNLLKDALEKLKFRDCSKEMEESWGFYQYDELSDNEALMHSVDRFTIVNLRRDRKKLNKTKLSRAWRKEVKAQEEQAGMVFDKPKRNEVRETVKKKMFREVDPDEAYFKAVYDSLEQRLYVLTSTPSDCELFIEKLNRALEPQKISISFKADTMQDELGETLTSWLYTPAKAEEHGFIVGDDMMLMGQDDSRATLKKQVADSSEVREHLGKHKQVKSLKISCALEEEGTEVVTYVLTGTRILSQMDLNDVCRPLCKAERDNHEDVNALKDAEFQIWFTALSQLWTKVLKIPID